MTIKTSRAALAALMIAASSLAMTEFALAQNERAIGEGGSRAGRPQQATAKPAAGPTLSSATGRVLGNVQKLLGEQKNAEALAALKEAKPETDYDKLKVNEFMMVAAIRTGDEAGAATAAMAAADLPADSIPEEDKQPVYLRAAQLANNTKQYDKAVVYAKQLAALNPTDAASRQVIPIAIYNGAPPAEAIAFFQQQIDASVAAGQRPSRDMVNMKINSHLKANDNPGAEATMEQALLFFNQPNDWDQMFNVAITTAGIRDIDALMLGRLMFASGMPISKENAQLIGETSQKMAMYGDAQQAQSKGATLQLDTARINGDKASMAEQIKMGASQNGVFNVKLAEALYGYGMFAEAETAARAGLAKGGADASEAQMLIAMSLYQQGKLAEATQAFNEVKGGSAATPRVARLWNTFIKIKQNPPPAAAQ